MCEGKREPGDLGLDAAPRGHDLLVRWEATRAWLRRVHRPGDRWAPELLDRSLRRIARRPEPAAYWTAHEAVSMMGEATRMLHALSRRLGATLPEPVVCEVPYRARGKPALARDRVVRPAGVVVAGDALRHAGLVDTAGQRVLELLGFLADRLTREDGGPHGFLLVPRPCPPSGLLADLGPLRDPGPLDITDPDNVVAYLRWRAVHQIHHTFREYHAADAVLARMRAGDDAFRDAIEAACARLVCHGQEPETIDMAYHLTSSRSSPQLFAAVLDRLEAGDLPPPGPPLHKDLPTLFRDRLASPRVAADPALRPRAEALLEAAGDAEALLSLALYEGPGDVLARRLRAVEAEELGAWTARCVAERVAADPGGYLDALEALGRGGPEVHAAFWRALEELAPPWLEERRVELEARLPPA